MKKESSEVKKVLESKPLYVEILKTIMDLEEQKVETNPSNICKKLNKGASTISEPLTQMAKESILSKKHGEDKRKNIYSIVDKLFIKKILMELESLESLRKSRLRLTSESQYIVHNVEDKITKKMSEQMQKISNKIQVMKEYPIRTVFGDQRVDLVVSSFEKIKIGIEYKIFLSEKKLRESRLGSIRTFLPKKYFTEIFGSYMCAAEGEIDGLLLVIVIPGIDKETKIQLENSVEKMKSKNFNIDILIADIKSNEFESELVIENFSKEIISKVDELKDNALNILEKKRDESQIEKYAWNSTLLTATKERYCRIAIIGIGGAGNNMLSWLFKKGIVGAELIAINSDQQHLNIVEADKKILIGIKTCGGLGCGGNIKNGIAAVKENKTEINEFLKNRDMVIILAGMGGGTGGGGAPLIAELAKEMGILTLSFVTMPFLIERARVDKAKYSLEEISKFSDTVFIIDNNRLSTIAGNLPIQQMFGVANELVSTIIKGIVETLAVPNLINLDFVDLKEIMVKGGISTIGVGISDSKNRVEEAVKGALSNPLLDVNYKTVTGALIHIEGGPDMSLDEVNRIGELVTEKLNGDAEVIWGAKVSENMRGKIAVLVLIIGVKIKYLSRKQERKDIQLLSLERNIK